jgi:regulator of sirC expression with transglutaminase-like and TPR domain
MAGRGGASDPYGRFVAAVAAPPAAIPLDEVALCIAAQAEPDLDVDAYLGRLDDLAAGVRAPTLDGLVSHLFGNGGFVGNRLDYYDPRNSLLNHVIDRRTGIPITLSVVTMEVGRRIGVPVAGVGMPGHFLLRDKVDPSVFVDPFHRGRYLDAVACRAVFHSAAGQDAAWDPSYLDPVDRPTIIVRMLANLRVIYERRGDQDALRWLIRLRCELPGVTEAERAELARRHAPYN